MKCPIDGSKLNIKERYGVEIDYCSRCLGVWLDKSELQKLILHSERVRLFGHLDEADHGKPEHKKRGGKRIFLADVFNFL